MPDDSVTRRGGALMLAGAASALRATIALLTTSQRVPTADWNLLGSMSDNADIARYMTEAFLDDYTEHVTAADNAPVVETGRKVMAGYLTGETNLVRVVTATLAEWRIPFTQTPDILPTKEVYAPETDTAPSLLGVYLLTEVRHDLHANSEGTDKAQIEAAHNAAMDAHNAVVRATMTVHNGNEITHTGKGIFAHFVSPDDALDAAIDVQRWFGAHHGPGVAIGLIGNSNDDEDPNFSPALSRHVQAVVAKAGSGEILCEHRVQHTAKHPHLTQTAHTAEDQTGNSDMADPLVIIAVETIPSATFESARVS